MMCGINGFNWSDATLIKKMNQSIKHRGPDDDGFFFNNVISLGHTRLSVIDLSEKAKQPMTNEDKSLWLIYNGEIYNFQKLKEKLENQGHVFKSKTDAEVILHSYEENGMNSFSNFNGIFAFCLYDSKKQLLILVRDRLGVKPLYYFHNENKFVFSSEIKAFFNLNEISPMLDNTAILEYFFTRNISSESFFKNIQTLEPGHYLIYDLENNTLLKREYFNIYAVVSKEQYLNNKKRKEKELIEELDELLNTVVRDQLVADIPVGTICSGGIDSSLLTAIAKKYCKNLKIFNVSVNDKELDESKFAKRVADYLGLKLIEEQLNKNNFNELYKKCITLADLPLIHTNSVGIYLISKRAKEEGLSVLLSGEGADELFGGYPQYEYFFRRLFLTKTPILDFLNASFRNFYYFKDFTNYMLDDSNYIITQYKNVPWNKERNIINKRFFDALDFLEENFEREMSSYILKDLKYYLVPLLRRADRMAMGVGLEMRVPYLDNKLVDFAINIPLKYKVRFFKTKYLLKKVAERYLPKDIIYRKKMGFGIPTEKWLGDESLDFKKIMYTDWEKIYFCR
jgi:asparagine synthase (glutamine-hydrolysing)